MNEEKTGMICKKCGGDIHHFTRTVLTARMLRRKTFLTEYNRCIRCGYSFHRKKDKVHTTPEMRQQYSEVPASTVVHNIVLDY